MGDGKFLPEFEQFLDSLEKRKAKPLPDFTPSEIYRELDRYVIGQHAAKRKISIAAYNHIKRIKHNTRRLRLTRPGLTRPGQISAVYPIKKANILLYGPTGCGKTHLARHLARILEIPICIVDATDYTEAGYYGKDVETMIGELLLQTGSIEEAQRGIVFIDEIDKIARRIGGARTGAGNRDIGGEGVQQALLKLLEGNTIFTPLNVTQHWSKHDFIQVDVSDILFICAGAFSDLGADESKDVQGFTSDNGRSDSNSKHLTLESFHKYGFTPEFLARLPVRIPMRALSSEEFLRILTNPPDSILKEYKALLKLDGITLNVSKQALRPVVEYVVSNKLGARSLRTVMEAVLEDVMFSAPECRGSTIRVTREFVVAQLAKLET